MNKKELFDKIININFDDLIASNELKQNFKTLLNESLNNLDDDFNVGFGITKKKLLSMDITDETIKTVILILQSFYRKNE